MKFIHLLLFVSLFLTACTAAGPTPPAAASYLKLVTAGEPGVPLLIRGQVLDAANQAPISGAEIFVFQTDTNGDYQPTDPADESTARLSGTVISDVDGLFTLETILPGEYDQVQEGNRHIHLEYVRADGYAQTGGLILFDFNVNDAVRAWAKQTGFGTILSVTEEESGRLVGDLVLFLKKNE